jgi:hypothetical protein
MFKCLTTTDSLFNNFLWSLRRGLQTLSLRFILYMGWAVGFEPELVKLAALSRYQFPPYNFRVHTVQYTKLPMNKPFL